MRVCVHRGAHEIGGSLVELEAEGSRLVLDAGLQLEPGAYHIDLLPDVPGLWAEGDGSMLALLISHGHPDHYGLADLVDPAVPIFLGEQAAAILAEASFFVPGMQPFSLGGHLRHRQPLRFGPFVVTPWLVDHSAFDAYALLVEAGGLLYTGDVRAHGRKPQTLEALARGAAGADVLLLEGTRIGRDRAARAERTEADVEAACATAFRANDGLALAFYSAQNVDRLVTLYRAAKRAGRMFVMDLYTAAIAAATGRDTIPQAVWEDVRVYLPRSQRRRVINAGAFGRTDAVRGERIYPDELRERRANIVLTSRGSMVTELEDANCLERAIAIWSMWPGYLERPSGRRTVSQSGAAPSPATRRACERSRLCGRPGALCAPAPSRAGRPDPHPSGEPVQLALRQRRVSRRRNVVGGVAASYGLERYVVQRRHGRSASRAAIRVTSAPL